MSVIVDGSNGLIFNDASTQTTAATGFGFKNRLINGDMRIDQRYSGSAANNSSDGIYVLDRWQLYGYPQNPSAISAQQVSTAPTGYAYSQKITSLGAATIGSSAYLSLCQCIEGYNIIDLAWGTASAAPITISFWVNCSLTGTFGGSLQNSGRNQCYPFTYTINSANTWERKTVTILGPTSGTWTTTNGMGIQLAFQLGIGTTYGGTAGAWTTSNKWGVTGTVNMAATNGATWYITGVQLEKGSTATDFDYRDFGREFIMCQRYYQRCWDYGTATGTVVAGPVGGTWQYNQYSFFLGTGNYGINCGTPFPTVMRATPTITIYSAANGTAGSVTPWNSSDYSITSNGGFVNASTTRITGASYNNGTTAGLVYAFYWTAAAEL